MLLIFQGIALMNLGLFLVEHIGGLTVEKLTRQVSRAIQYGLEDVAVERLHFFQSVEPSVVFCNYVLNTCARAGNSQVILSPGTPVFHPTNVIWISQATEENVLKLIRLQGMSGLTWSKRA